MLLFSLFLYFTYTLAIQWRSRRVRQRWYNRSAVTGAGLGRGGEGTDGLAAYLHSARTLKTQKTKQTVNYPCFLCISVQRRGWRAERRGDQAEGREGGQGTLRGSTPNPLVLYIEILVYTAFLSLGRNLFDGTGGLCGPRCWCWSGARISREGPKQGWPRLACGGGGRGAPRGWVGRGSRGGAGVPLGLSIGGRKFS